MENLDVDTLFLDLGEWDQAIGVYTRQLARFPDSARLHYYLGLAYYRKATSSRESVDHQVLLGALSREETAWLSEALSRFKFAADLDPMASLTANAYYLAGQCLDIGRLQRFEEAIDYYRVCSENFPGTEAGWRCLERYELLKKRFEGAVDSPHGMGM